ncbi:MAG TPA: alpha/beta hydrolase [Candidatus Saccharimonadales bacterium]|nr:alpha/beta hydrolase [Candidatus Saccharimonadales bacterium]
MVEKELQIPLRDGKIADAIVNGEWKNQILIFVHGMTGEMDDTLLHLAARYFKTQGFTVLRFNLYSGKSNARHMANCDLTVHVGDLNEVIDFARSHGAQSIHLVGHSLGAYSLMMANQTHVSSVTMWDPSPFGVPLFTTPLQYIKQVNGYLYEGRVSYIFSKRYLKSLENFDPTKLLKKWTTPTLIVSSDAAAMIESAGKYKKLMRGASQVKLHTIKGADHAFTQDKWMRMLFNVTHRWIQAAP